MEDEVTNLKRTIGSMKTTIKLQNIEINDLKMSYHELKKSIVDIVDGKFQFIHKQFQLEYKIKTM